MRISWLMCGWVAAMAGWQGALRAEEPATEASVGSDGVLRLSAKGKELCAFHPGVFNPKWQQAGASADFKNPPADKTKRVFHIQAPGGPQIDGEAAITAKENGAVQAAYSFTPQADATLNTIHVSAEFAIATVAGAKWTAGDQSGEVPADFKDVHLFSGAVKTLKLELPAGGTLEFSFDAETQVLLQDNRKWGPSFSIRIGPQGDAKKFAKGERVAFGFALTAKGGLALTYDGPTTITAGPEWIPLNLELEIEADSALDFSKMGLTNAPAGKFGRVIATPDGQFVFEKDPGTPRRFYGVNFCFSAQYLTHEQADQVADRLMRLGYNAVRIHHYEGELVSGQANSTTFNPDKIDQLDYLLAAFAKRGLYITTDLFVSRPVPWKEIGVEKPGNVPMDTFKILVPVHSGAKENWKRFAKTMLDHENPYTKRRYAEEPALAWLSMINEGNFGNFLGAIRGIPEWKTAWNAWLAKQYPERAKLAEAWDKELKDAEDPAKGAVELPDNIYADGARVRDCNVFFAATEKEMVEEMKKFLREDLGCKALVTNMNAWTNPTTNAVARTVYDYVDDHFYVDHPHFIDKPWRLPSRCPNTSPIAGGASGGRSCAFTRHFGKPFTITEYNYSCPGRFRGVGGILTGALGALQGWSGIWRFAYSHDRNLLLKPGKIGYFDMSSDPLGQASERASICLFLRGDMKAAPGSVSIRMTPEEAAPKGKVPGIAPRWNWAAWVTRVGLELPGSGEALKHSAVLPAGEASREAAKEAAAKDLSAYSADSDKVLALLKERGLIGKENSTDPAKQVWQSETGEIGIDALNDTLTLDTPRTAGGYAPVGKTITAGAGAVKIKIVDTDATVFICALDGKAIAESKRLLVTHLTDLQNSEIKYAEKARQTLLDWGKLPHLVHSGKATVSIALKDAKNLKVWALSTGGKRLGEVKAEVKDGILEFTADVAGGGEQGARMLYEIAAP